MMELIIFLFLLTCQFLSETFSKNIPRLSAPLFRGREVEEVATGVKVQLNCSELAGEDLKNIQFGNMEKLKHKILTKGVLYIFLTQCQLPNSCIVVLKHLQNTKTKL